MQLKLMTFNIQHGRNHNLPGDVIDLPLMASTVNAQSPDIIGFNEVRGKGVIPSFPNEPMILSSLIGGSRRFASAITVNNGGPYGNLLISKKKIVSSRRVMIPDCERVEGEGGYETRCMIEAVIDCEGKPLTVLISHFGLRDGERENAVNTALSLVQKSANPVVLMGDFNMMPDDLLIKKLASEMTDASAPPYNKNPGNTFSSDSPRMKIDYIFTKGVRVLYSEIVRVIASDHFPLTSVIEI